MENCINVIGLGYIGLPTALILAKCGFKVVGSDHDITVINSLNNGELIFKEKGLKNLYKDAKSNGIKFTTEYQKTKTYILALPTPFMRNTKKLDPKYII